MKFRIQGKKVQCVRFGGETGKRGWGKVVASFAVGLKKLPQAEIQALTAEERRELARWLEAREGSQVTQVSAERVRGGGALLDELAQAVKVCESLTDEQANALWMGMGRLARALRKAGQPKPKRQATTSTVLAGQADLLAELTAEGDEVGGAGDTSLPADANVI
jgi:hypothetical protein